MSKNNQVVMQSTTTHGYLYRVYHKDDTERKKTLYTGEISTYTKHCYCECLAYVHGMNCYHQEIAKSIMGVVPIA